MELHPVIYNLLIDPLLGGIRTRIIKNVKQGMKVIDIACGTGRLARQLSEAGAKVTGIDIEPSMIHFCQKKNNSLAKGNPQFFLADARSISKFGDRQFQLATMTLALHQFSPADWGNVLEETMRISDELLVADYYFPLPSGTKKKLVYLVERVAGKEHSLNFRAFMKEGGVLPIIEKHGLVCTFHERSPSGIFGQYRIVKGR